MTINLLTRPALNSWEPPATWTLITLDGDDEDAVANVITSQLLLTRYEVLLDEDADPLEPDGDDDGQTS